MYPLTNGLISYCRTNKDDAEYISKDGFVKKAAEFFAPRIQDNSGGYDRAKVIEDFEEYLKK